MRMFKEKFICISIHQHCLIYGLMRKTEHKTTSARVTIIKKTIKSAGENVDKRNPRALLVGMGSGTATLKKFSILKMLNAELPCDPISLLLPKKMENMSTENLPQECS